MAKGCVVVDVNNVRGSIRFPELCKFCCAVCRWAQSGTLVVFLMIDHGVRPAAFELSERCVVVFAGGTGAVITHD